MIQADVNQCVLPLKRTGMIVRQLAEWSVRTILLLGLLAYVLPVLVVSGIEYCCSPSNELAWVKAGDRGITEFWELVYFNFITILTIGYGDFAPHGPCARVLSVAEAVIGTGIMTVTMSALVAKFLSPPTNAIVFSRYAYYCTDDQKFMVIYVNTTLCRLVNADQTGYFKLGGDWRVTPPVRSPLITQAVQTFFAVGFAESELVKELSIDRPEDRLDMLRFGISGHIGGGSISVAIEYASTDIIVLQNRDELTAYPGFRNVKFDDAEFQSMFHFRPKGALTLVEYVQNRRCAAT